MQFNYPFYPQYYQTNQQNSAFVSVRSIEEAINYPVAPGNSITFKVENTPYVCTKTKGFSPLDQPVFEKYRLVKEEEPATKPPEPPVQALETQQQIEQLWNEINALKSLIRGNKRNDKSADTNKVSAVRKQSGSLPDENGDTAGNAE